MNHEERKQKILEITESLQNLSLELGKLIASCTHDPVESDGIMVCGVCQRHLGWRCEESPDKTCHYQTIEHPVAKVRGIILIDGNFYPMDFKEDYNPKEESIDHCLFCGKPVNRPEDKSEDNDNLKN